MKKIVLILISLALLVGCTLGNTPTSRVEELLSKYQMQNDSILISYTSLTNDNNLTQELISKYEAAIKKQYRDLSYEVKDEVIDGTKATVTIQIEVMNYKIAINKYNKEDYEITKYHELVLNELAKTKEMTTYTLDITLTKNDNNIWKVNELTRENKEKLLGIY